MDPIIENLNNILENPEVENIFQLFDVDGYIRFNMLYVSPISIKHFKDKLTKLGLLNWKFTDTELVFTLQDQIIRFRGKLTITFKYSEILDENDGINTKSKNDELPRIFSLELDFDPIVNSDEGVRFLEEVEIFLKQCDACFFMTYFVSIDNEILSNPLTKSIEFLSQRK